MQTVGTLAAADDLAITFRGQNIHTQRELRPLRIRLHVKGLYRRRVTMHHNRPVELTREISLIRRSEISAPFETLLQLTLGMCFLKNLDRIVVLQSGEVTCNLFQF